MRVCKRCGKPFESKSKTKLYCSGECYNIVNRERVNRKLYEEVEQACECCGTIFVKTRYSKRLYCSGKCRGKMQKATREAKATKVVHKAKSIGELQREAWEHGMSYGKYVASMQKGVG